MPAIRVAFLAVLIALFAFSTSTAQAHSDLVSSDPIANSELAALPSAITLNFSEQILVLDAAGANQIVATMDGGNHLETGEVNVSGAKVSVALKPSTDLGEVTVGYRVVSADGHPIEGSFKFWVGKRESAEPSSQNDSNSKSPETAWVWLGLSIPAFIFFAVTLIQKSKRKR